MTIKEYNFESEGKNHKYQVYRDTETSSITDIKRGGEHWDAGYESFRFAKMFHAMLNRIDEIENTENRLFDLLKNDDPQAFKEGRKHLEQIRPDLAAKL